MFRIAAITFLVFPFFCKAQTEKSPDIIFQKFLKLSSESRLDSVKLQIIFSKQIFNYHDTIEQLYIYQDTIRMKDGRFSVGRIIIDPFMQFNDCRIGEWKTFYPNEQLFSEGNYQTAAYVYCTAGGPLIQGYDFQIDRWSYWYSNGLKMAEGKFLVTRKKKTEHCGTDFIISPTMDENWLFYDKNGFPISLQEFLTNFVNYGGQFLPFVE